MFKLAVIIPIHVFVRNIPPGWPTIVTWMIYDAMWACKVTLAVRSHCADCGKQPWPGLYRSQSGVGQARSACCLQLVLNLPRLMEGGDIMLDWGLVQTAGGNTRADW